MPALFISYRRSDSQDVTGRIYDRLLAKFTQKQVFKDVDSIPIGVSFPAHIKQMLGKTGVVLVIIGPNWLHAKDEHGNRRLDDPKDYVRLEIEIALRGSIPVVPVLVSNARMPLESELPQSIQPLALRNGTAIRPDPDFNNDMVRLLAELDRLDKLLNAESGKPPQPKLPIIRPETELPFAETIDQTIPARRLPVIRPTLMAENAPVDRARRQSTARRAHVSGVRRSRKLVMLPMVGMLLLIAAVVGLWAGGAIRLKTPTGGSPAGDSSSDQYDLTGGDRFVHFGPAGPRVVLCSKSENDSFARVYNLATGEAVTPPLKLDSDHWVSDASFSPDGRRVVTKFGASSTANSARVWDVATGKPLTPAINHNIYENSSEKIMLYLIKYAAFSPDSKKVITCGVSWARVYDAATGEKLLSPLKASVIFNKPMFSLDGGRILSGSGKTVQVYDAITGKAAAPPLMHEEDVRYAGFSPDGRRIVTISNKTARVWDAASSKEVTPPLKHEGDVWHAVFSPDSRRVVTASQDKTARVWDAATGKALTSLLQHEEAVERANFSADGTRVVTASLDKTARLWNAVTGQSALQPLKHDARVRRAAFSPDGKYVATVDYNDARWLWDAQTGQELKKLTAPSQ